jgi:hypothetical protein
MLSTSIRADRGSGLGKILNANSAFVSE